MILKGEKLGSGSEQRRGETKVKAFGGLLERRAVAIKKSVRSSRVVVFDVLRYDAPEMPLPEDDHVVEAVLSDGPDHSFAIRILPWTVGRDCHFLDAHSVHPVGEEIAVGAIVVSQDKPRRRVPGKGLGQLDRSPQGRRICCNVEMDDSPRGVLQNDESVEDSECGRGQGEEVDGSDLRGMVPEECAPRHGPFFAAAVDVFPDGRGGDGVAQQRQDLLDHGRSPVRIGSGDLTDETPEHRIRLGSARRSALPGFPVPVQLEPHPVPTFHSVWLRVGKSRLPFGPDLGHPDPEDSISLRQLGAGIRPAQRGNLLPQTQILRGHVFLALQKGPEYIENDGEKGHEGLLQGGR